MSKLSKIVQSLEANPKVGLIHKALDLSPSTSKHGLSNIRNVEYFVAPKKRLYTVESLQNFMIDLIPNKIEMAHSRDDFYETSYNLYFGSLLYRDYQTEGESVDITIRPFPSKGFAKNILKSKVTSKYSVNKELLEKHNGVGHLDDSYHTNEVEDFITVIGKSFDSGLGKR